MEKKRIQIEQLEKGMLVAEDVYSARDQLIVTKNTFITDKILAKLKVYQIPAIYIWKNKSEGTDAETESSYANTLCFTKEYQSFQENYREVVKGVKRLLNGMIKDKKILNMKEELFPKVDALYHNVDYNRSMLDMIHTMRDQTDEVYTHSVNVGLIGSALGKWLHFTPEEMGVLIVSGFIHDIGKLMIPENILLKSFKLTDKEYQIVRSHAARGYQIVKDMDIKNDIKQVVLMHHERCDGSGYPIGMKGNQINRYAKVIAIADVYDAMTSNRIYRDSVCPFDVIAQFEADGFQFYETEYIITFLKNIANTYMNSRVRLSDGSVGEVILLNPNRLSKPVVKAGENYVDLSLNSEIKIEEVL